MDLARKLDALCYVSKIGMGMEDTLDTIMFYDSFIFSTLLMCLLWWRGIWWCPRKNKDKRLRCVQYKDTTLAFMLFQNLQYEIIFPTALPERCTEMLNLYLYSDSRWDCLEIQLLPLKRIVWEAFKLIGKEFQNYCMRWVVHLFETNLKWWQIGLNPYANHCFTFNSPCSHWCSSHP